MKVRLHVGPHRTGTTYIQYAAFANREALAEAGVLFINKPAQCVGIPRALIALDAEGALGMFDQLLAEARSEIAGAAKAQAVLYSSEVFFEADPRQRPQYEAAYAKFLEGLGKRGHEVEIVFVERDLEDLLTSNALLQTSMGNLRYVGPSATAFLEYVETYSWLKSMYFASGGTLHLDFAALTASGDLFANFTKAGLGVSLASPRSIDPSIDARNSLTDRQVARGLLLAPIVNWLELFGSVPRFELFNAAQPLRPPVSEALLDEVVANVPMLRDTFRAVARNAIDSFVKHHGVATAA
ncbi:MAG TPA: hypothetical protein VH301_12225 [Usitatibacter sp.]|nr:hypothetical protein [Usitatibacter sp.]